jgi:hypothetical protein
LTGVIAAPSRGDRKGWSAWSSPSGLRRLLIVGAFVVLFAALGVGIYGVTTSHPTNLSDPQSWLPAQQLHHSIDATMVGTVAKPAITVEGDFVEVRTPTFSARALVTGPIVPGEGLPKQTDFTTCTWTISLSHVVGRVPVSVADFDSIDHAQSVFKPYLVPGQPRLPSNLRTGQRLTFKIRAVMPVGEGLMRWAPDGDHIVAKWDYQVETD